MNFSTFPRLALLVISDAIGRIDYDAADMEAAREAVRDAVEAAIAAAETARGADTSALPSLAFASSEAVVRAARAKGWLIAYDDEQDIYAATAPEGSTVWFGNWQSLNDAPRGCVYEWRFAGTSETQPGLWLNESNGDNTPAQCRIATLTFALPSPSTSDTDALPSAVRSPADTTALHCAGDVTWTVGQQRAAEAQGWAIVTRGKERELSVVTLDGERFLTSAEAGEHVEEGARGGHAFTDDYVALCRAALAVVEAHA